MKRKTVTFCSHVRGGDGTQQNHDTSWYYSMQNSEIPPSANILWVEFISPRVSSAQELKMLLIFHPTLKRCNCLIKSLPDVRFNAFDLKWKVEYNGLSCGQFSRTSILNLEGSDIFNMKVIFAIDVKVGFLDSTFFLLMWSCELGKTYLGFNRDYLNFSIGIVKLINCYISPLWNIYRKYHYLLRGMRFDF